MIGPMSLRSSNLVAMLVVAAACGAPPKPAPTGSDEPTTAKEKQLREARANGELDDGKAKWGKWRYQGDRKDCFYLTGGKCFKTQKAACAAARCKGEQTCTATGGGPVVLVCK